MNKIVRVSISDAKTGVEGEQLFTVVGSCIAVMLYDKKIKVGGMLHIMLDYQKGREENICKYADTGIPFLVRSMVKRGASTRRLLGAKIAGGAMVLGKEHYTNIGESNLLAVKDVLKKLGIQVIASDCGGLRSRRIIFDVTTGKVTVQVHGRRSRIL